MAFKVLHLHLLILDGSNDLAGTLINVFNRKKKEGKKRQRGQKTEHMTHSAAHADNGVVSDVFAARPIHFYFRDRRVTQLHARSRFALAELSGSRRLATIVGHFATREET